MAFYDLNEIACFSDIKFSRPFEIHMLGGAVVPTFASLTRGTSRHLHLANEFLGGRLFYALFYEKYYKSKINICLLYFTFYFQNNLLLQ